MEIERYIRTSKYVWGKKPKYETANNAKTVIFMLRNHKTMIWISHMMCVTKLKQKKT